MRNQPTEMLCPTCAVPLTIAERSGVEIDFCPRCRGVWLDRGELDKILERAARLDRDRYDDDDDDDYRRRGPQPGGTPYAGDAYAKPYGKKPKSRWDFLKEILD